jgi:CHAT domain-containing protein
LIRIPKPLRRTAQYKLVRLNLISALAIALLGSSCRRSSSPDDTFAYIRDEMRRGQLDAALHDVDAAFNQYQSNGQEWAARFRVLKAHVLFLRGSYNDALTLLSNQLPDSLARSDAAVHRKMVQGLACTFLQRYSEADTFLSQAEDLGKSIDSPFQGDVAQARGILEMDLKDYAKAADAYRAAAAFANKRNLPGAELKAMASLGNIAMWLEHYDEAVDHFKSALEKSRLVGEASTEEKTLGNLGWNYSAIGDFENAEGLFTEAESKSAKASQTVDQIRWLTSLADIYFQQNRLKEANSAAEKAYSLAQNQDDKRIFTESLNVLSEMALAAGRLDEAGKFNRQALDIENAGLDKFGIAPSKAIAGSIAAKQKRFLDAERLFQSIIQDRSLESQLRWEAQAKLAQVYAAQGKSVLAEREFNEAIAAIAGARGAIKHEDFRLSFLTSAIRSYEAYVDFLIDRHRPLDALKIADLSRAQVLEQGQSSPNFKRQQNNSFNPQAIARQLQATLLFYWLGHEHSYLWAITPSKTSIFPLLPASGIESDLKSYRDTFVDPRDPFDSGKALGSKLYESLVLPAEKLIPKDSRVIVLPDRSLNALNFETLIVSNPNVHYWIEDVTISVANSLSMLAREHRETPPKTPNLLLFGDALFASKDFPVLPDSGKETDVLKKYFPDSRRSLFTKAGAKPSAYLSSNPGQYSYLHFATHGTASRLQPLESAIILSPEGDSFKLYARDIIQRPLTAYLVTISACNGAGVKVYAGEGLVGLAWAFLRAGAHNVIGGLWEVSNASTPQLMDELYKGLRKGDDPAVALRKAKLSFVHSTEYYSRPFYWAPFQLYSGS